MDSGLAVRLDPHGGNSLNVREVLCAAGIRPPPPAHERNRTAGDFDEPDEDADGEFDGDGDSGDDGDDGDGDDNGNSDGNNDEDGYGSGNVDDKKDGDGEKKGDIGRKDDQVCVALRSIGSAAGGVPDVRLGYGPATDETDDTMPRGLAAIIARHEKKSRRGQGSAQEEYDCHDGFIDDTELVECEQGFKPPSDAQGIVKEKGVKRNGSDAPVPRKDLALGHPRRLDDAETLGGAFEPAYKGFYISRGDIPLRPVPRNPKEIPKAGGPSAAIASTDKIQQKLLKLQQQKKKEQRHQSRHKDTLSAVGIISKRISKTPYHPNMSMNEADLQVLKNHKAETRTVTAQDSAQDSTYLSSNPVAKKRAPRDSEANAAVVPDKCQLPSTKLIAAAALDDKKDVNIARDVASMDSLLQPSAAVPKKRKSSDGLPVHKYLPDNVLTHISKLRDVCQAMFGEKKPRVNECLELQELLHSLLCEAKRLGLAKLQVERRSLYVQDILWTKLSFLRTTRSNLEALGYALHWDSEETSAKDKVRAAEDSLRSALDPHRGMSSSLTWTPAVREALHAWWKARCSLLDASNQLSDPNRQKSAKKALATWIPALVKGCFNTFDISEDDIATQIRTIEDAKMVAARRRREEERMERNAEKAERRLKRSRDVDSNVEKNVSSKRVPPVLWKLISTKKVPIASTSLTHNHDTAADRSSHVTSNAGSTPAMISKSVGASGSPTKSDAVLQSLSRPSNVKVPKGLRSKPVFKRSEGDDATAVDRLKTRAPVVSDNGGSQAQATAAPVNGELGRDAAFEVIELD